MNENKWFVANDNGDIIGHDMGEAKAKALAEEMQEKENLRRMRKHRNGSISLELYDPYKDFKAKIKEQIMNKEIKEND